MDKKEFAEYYNLCEQHQKEEPEPQFGEDDLSVINDSKFSTEKPKAKTVFNGPEEAVADVKEINGRDRLQHSKKFGGSNKAGKFSKD
jgi:hypothetical protein